MDEKDEEIKEEEKEEIDGPNLKWMKEKTQPEEKKEITKKECENKGKEEVKEPDEAKEVSAEKEEVKEPEEPKEQEKPETKKEKRKKEKIKKAETKEKHEDTEKTKLKEILKTYIFWFLNVLFFEVAFAFIMFETYQKENIVNILFSVVIVSSILSMIGHIFKGKANTVITSIILFVLGALFSIQCVFYHVFKVYFSVFNLGLADQLTSFLKDLFRLIGKNIIYILIFLLPFILYIIFHKKIKLIRNTLKNYIIYMCVLLISVVLFNVHINNTKGIINGAYDLYNNVNDVALNISRLGVINSYRLDIHRMIFGFSQEIKEVNADALLDKSEKADDDIIKYEDNILELNLSKSTSNAEIQKINEYIASDTGTKKNKYTGLFEGYNLIYITAESFSEIAISEELTPTLYKLTHSGFIFDNFYTPNNLSTIGGEFQTMTGLYPVSSILTKWRSGTNYFPYGLGTIFGDLGYNTFAYHNNAYTFQDRHKYMLSQGFTNYIGRYNGMEKRMNCAIWPQSDDDMINVTVSDYLESDEPFLAYYMTVSGHFPYRFDENNMARKHKDAVKDLDLSEEAKGYVASQIELDKALARLLDELEKSGKLDNTVIVLSADHYPYDLSLDDINSLSSYKRDGTVEINHNSLIIWNSKLNDIHITKPCMAQDIIPTVYNLFGIEYDSRLFTGRDILSDSFGIAIMYDKSWVTDAGTYFSVTGKFDAKRDVDEDYIINVNNLVNNRVEISRLIVKNDYYNYLFH